MARYLAEVQWCVKFVEIAPPQVPPLGDQLPVFEGPVSTAEVRNVVSRLRKWKSPGGDDVPPEFWQAMLQHAEGMTALTELCAECWRLKKIP